MPSLNRFINQHELGALIERARMEDLGPNTVDITSRCLLSPDSCAAVDIVPRQAGRLAGAVLLGAIVRAYDPVIDLQVHIADSRQLEPGTAVASLTGSLPTILALERVALNFLTHLSGIATLTRHYVDAIADTQAVICDTRKTLPTLRALEKYAVACGGGTNHRTGLYDAVLVKDNHIAHLSNDDLAGTLQNAMGRAQQSSPAPAFFQVEVDNLAQLQTVLNCKPDIVLLDNMTVTQLRDAVALRNRSAPHVQLEASGSITLTTVSAIAHTGVDRISVGAITNSAPAVDIGLDIA